MQVHAEINKYPINTLTLVLFLLEYEHVVVEKLLQSFVREVNAKLLESIKLSILTSSSESKSQEMIAFIFSCDEATTQTVQFDYIKETEKCAKF